ETTTFTIDPGTADHLTFTNSTGDLAASAMRALSAEVRDAAGNVETGDNTTVVTFMKTGGAGTVTGLGTATVSGGVTTQTVTGALAGAITISATANSLIADSTTFGVVAGAADHLTLTSSAANLASGVTRSLTAQVRDVGGNLVTSD